MRPFPVPLLAALVALAPAARAQHPPTTAPPRDTTRAACPPEHAAMGHCTPAAPSAAMDHAGHAAHGARAAADPAGPMTRDASGTAWNPDATPMEALHGRAGAWHTMLHGSVSPRFTAQDAFEAGTRGRRRFGAPNWAMGMAQRPVGAAGLLTLRAMLSLDPVTEGTRGYPLLFQTGEAVGGEPLVDEQHPHDLFSELAVTYAHRVRRGSVFGYAGYPGEPALGPVAFMHRPSARHLPDAPLGHHWQDATHIVFGVATAGVAWGPVKVEGSVFTGREPDEERFGFDRPRFDSYSGRVAYHPSARWTLQASSGFLRSPEAVEPALDVVRTTASAQHHRPTARGWWTSSVVWGHNRGLEDGRADDHHTGHSVLVESDLARGPLAVFGRAEAVQKSGDELGAGTDARFTIGALTVGAAHEVARLGAFRAMLGASGTAYAVPDGLRAAYGDAPVSAQVFLRITPAD